MPYRLINRSTYILPTGGALALGAFIALLVMGSSILALAQKRHGEQMVNYGQALATLAAKQSIDAAFNHDLVRLQLILQDVVANPHIMVATMHDVEQNLLVQAGNSYEQNTDKLLSLTAAVALNESIAGTVSVSLDPTLPGLSSLSKLLYASLLILLLVTVLYAYQARTLDFRLVRAGKSEVNNVVDDDLDSQTMNTGEQELAEIEKNTPCAYTVIHLKNRPVLEQQLNAQVLRKTCQRLEKIISDVLALYGGLYHKNFGHYYILYFSSGNMSSEALFRATCSAHIILELASTIHNVPLDLAAFVSANADDLTPQRLPVAGLVVESDAARDDVLQRRVKFMDLGTENGRKIVAGFHAPFNGLLDKQCQQLDLLL